MKKVFWEGSLCDRVQGRITKLFGFHPPVQSLGHFTVPISSYVHSYDATEDKIHFAGVDRATLVRPSQLPNGEYTIQANLIVLKIPISRQVKPISLLDITLYLEGRDKEAKKILFKSNPLLRALPEQFCLWICHKCAWVARPVQALTEGTRMWKHVSTMDCDCKVSLKKHG